MSRQSDVGAVFKAFWLTADGHKIFAKSSGRVIELRNHKAARNFCRNNKGRIKGEMYLVYSNGVEVKYE